MSILDERPPATSFSHCPDLYGPNMVPTEAAEALDKIMADVVEAVKKMPETIRREVIRKAKPYYAIEDVAELANRSPSTVRRWIDKGDLESIRVPGPRGNDMLMVPGTEMVKLFLGGLGVFVPPEKIETLNPESY